MHYYLNENKEAIPCDLLTWARQLEEMPFEERLVGRDHVGGKRISTVWLGTNHNMNSEVPPHLFETAVFEDGKHVRIIERYSTWKEAEEGHKQTIEGIKNEK